MTNSYPYSLSVWHPSYPVQHLPISEQPSRVVVLHALQTLDSVQETAGVQQMSGQAQAAPEPPSWMSHGQ